MKLRAAIHCIILLVIFSCDQESEPSNDNAFHITYGFPMELGSQVSVVSIGDLSIIVANLSAENASGLLCIDEFGKVIWSKIIKAPNENGLTSWTLSKAQSNTFLIAGNLGSGQPIVIQFDLGGNILSSKKYLSGEGITLEKISTNSIGTKIGTGYYYANNVYNGFAFKEDKNGNIIWSVSRAGEFLVQGLINEPETNTFLFPAFNGSHTGQTFIKLDNDGNITHTSELSKSSDLTLKKVVSIENNFYLLYTEWHMPVAYLIKVNENGEFVKGIKFEGCENPEIDTDGSNIFFALTVEGNVNVIECNSELSIINQKTVVNLIGGDATTLNGVIEVSEDAIISILKPFSIDPTFGNKGLNVIKFRRDDWKTKCKISQVSAGFINSNFQSNENSSFISVFDVESEDVVLEVQNIVINKVDICK